MARRYWLVKSEPSAYSWSDFVEEARTCWDGVRNNAARLNLIEMRQGDQVLFYHSVSQKAVVGIARVTRESYPDPTADDPRWVAVDPRGVRENPAPRRDLREGQRPLEP
jgi:predicted RNA-binding protein with PUA-like domain